MGTSFYQTQAEYHASVIKESIKGNALSVTIRAETTVKALAPHEETCISCIDERCARLQAKRLAK